MNPTQTRRAPVAIRSLSMWLVLMTASRIVLADSPSSDPKTTTAAPNSNAQTGTAPNVVEAPPTTSDAPATTWVNVSVHSESKGTFLQQHHYEHRGQALVSKWVDLCELPCSARVAQGSAVRVAGPGVVPSRTKYLEQPIDVNLVSKPGYSVYKTLGILGITIGGPVAWAGFDLYSYPRWIHKLRFGDKPEPAIYQTLADAGVWMMALGSIAVSFGLSLYWNHNSTTLDQKKSNVSSGFRLKIVPGGFEF